MANRSLLKPHWTSSFARSDGVRLHLVEVGPSDGPLVLLLHGFPEFWWAWRHQIDPFAAAGYHVVAPDLRSYNLSDAPPGIAAYRLDLLAADILAIAGHFGARRFQLVGHDWGGVIAWRVAERHPDRVERLVILDAPHPNILGPQARKHPVQALRSSYTAFFQLPRLPEAALRAFRFAGLRRALARTARPGVLTPEDLDGYAEAWSRGSLRGMINFYRALRMRTPSAPSRIRPPTLILWGEKDAFLEPHLARASLDLCDAGRLEIVRDATHWLHWEEPALVTRAILGFLSPPASSLPPADA